MNEEKLSNYRVEVITKFINLETIMNSIISQHYFKHGNMPFLTQVLYNPYFTFALRLDILKQITPIFDSKKEEYLHKLNRIRNYFAHCSPNFFKVGTKVSKESIGYMFDPKDPSKILDFEDLHKEFNDKEEQVVLYLIELYEGLGGQMKTEEDVNSVKKVNGK